MGIALVAWFQLALLLGALSLVVSAIVNVFTPMGRAMIDASMPDVPREHRPVLVLIVLTCVMMFLTGLTSATIKDLRLIAELAQLGRI